MGPRENGRRIRFRKYTHLFQEVFNDMFVDGKSQQKGNKMDHSGRSEARLAGVASDRCGRPRHEWRGWPQSKRRWRRQGGRGGASAGCDDDATVEILLCHLQSSSPSARWEAAEMTEEETV